MAINLRPNKTIKIDNKLVTLDPREPDLDEEVLDKLKVTIEEKEELDPVSIKKQLKSLIAFIKRLKNVQNINVVTDQQLKTIQPTSSFFFIDFDNDKKLKRWDGDLQKKQNMILNILTGRIKADGTIDFLSDKSVKVNKTSVGQYLVTHNLGNSDYSVSITPLSLTVAPQFLQSISSLSNNTFTVNFVNLSLQPADSDFSFLITVV